LISWAIKMAWATKRRTVQIAMDRRWERAGNFYGRLGFIALHGGFKMTIDLQSEIDSA
tara:strand:+ start:3108 stop:3281 length:174 start_codon:yes stop_codon:yes gene_type:complete